MLRATAETEVRDRHSFYFSAPSTTQACSLSYCDLAEVLAACTSISCSMCLDVFAVLSRVARFPRAYTSGRRVTDPAITTACAAYRSQENGLALHAMPSRKSANVSPDRGSPRLVTIPQKLQELLHISMDSPVRPLPGLDRVLNASDISKRLTRAAEQQRSWV